MQEEKNIQNLPNVLRTSSIDRNRRIELLEESVKQNTALTVSIEKLANNMESMANEQAKQGERLEALEGRDGEMWRTVVKYVLTAALGLVIGLVATQIGL